MLQSLKDNFYNAGFLPMDIAIVGLSPLAGFAFINSINITPPDEETLKRQCTAEILAEYVNTTKPTPQISKTEDGSIIATFSPLPTKEISPAQLDKCVSAKQQYHEDGRLPAIFIFTALGGVFGGYGVSRLAKRRKEKNAVPSPE